MLRVEHFLRWPKARDSELIAALASTRGVEGCMQAEAYRAVDDDENVVVLELWQDQQVYASHWSSVLADGTALLLEQANRPGCSPSEFYRYQTYQWRGRWTATSLPDSGQRIFWPNRGAVRIAIQITVADGEAVKPRFADDAAATRREPGCLAFDWMQSLEWPHHYLLNELWTDQAIYDAHIGMRVKVAEARGETYGTGARPPAPPREHGTNGLEFYRQQPFRHLYDRWQPDDVTRWSETVVWSD